MLKAGYSGLCLVVVQVAMAAQLPAMADELFICGGNKIVRVAVDDLEAMKRTNACVASHYGLEVAPAARKPAHAPRKSSNKSPGAPLKSTKSVVDHVQKAHQPASKARIPSKARIAGKKRAPVKQGQSPVKAETPTFKIYQPGDSLPVEEIQTKPSDYRNIRILNGKGDKAQWHRHVY